MHIDSKSAWVQVCRRESRKCNIPVSFHPSTSRKPQDVWRLKTNRRGFHFDSVAALHHPFRTYFPKPTTVCRASVRRNKERGFLFPRNALFFNLRWEVTSLTATSCVCWRIRGHLKHFTPQPPPNIGPFDKTPSLFGCDLNLRLMGGGQFGTGPSCHCIT